MLSAFFKDSAGYALTALVSRGMSLLLVPLYTRVLSPRDYGSLDLLTVFGSIVNLTIALEVSQGLARYHSSVSDLGLKVAYASTALWFTVLCYSIFALMTLSFAPFLSAVVMGQSGMEASFRLGLAYVWCNGIFYLIQNQFRWEFRVRDYALVSLLMSFMTAGSSFLFAFLFHWGLEGMLLGMVLGSLAGAICGLWLLRNSFRFLFDLGCLREMLTFSTPLVFSGVAVWASLYIDRIMINQWLSVEAVGLYGVGYRVASIAGLVMIGFQGAMSPIVYAHHHDVNAPSQLAKIFRFFIFFALFVFVALSVFADNIVRLLVAEKFFGGSVAVPYLVPAILLANMYIFAPGANIAKKTHLIVLINIVGATLNIGLNYMLIPILGVRGAGLATLMSSLTVFIMYMMVSQKLYFVPHRWIQIIIPSFIAFATVIFCAIFHANESSSLYLDVALVVFVVVIGVLFGLIRFGELRAIVVMLKSGF